MSKKGKTCRWCKGTLAQHNGECSGGGSGSSWILCNRQNAGKVFVRDLCPERIIGPLGLMTTWCHFEPEPDEVKEAVPALELLGINVEKLLQQNAAEQEAENERS